MSKTRILTGITTTGTPHLGNYVGAIRPAIAASRVADVESFFFLADYHALIKTDDPARIQQSTLEIAASWLACGLDPEKVYFYRQSDIPEIPELTWLLTCVTAKGLLNRAHAYKAANDANRTNGEDPDAGITAGLYMYPVLMAADILVFNANKVPVGRDQVQHIEMARDIGQRFNHIYGAEYFPLPEASIEENVATLPGLDGRKMSKSYGNTIGMREEPDVVAKKLRAMQTDPARARRTDPGDPEKCPVWDLHKIYSDDATRAWANEGCRTAGIGCLDCKQPVIDKVVEEVTNLRKRAQEFEENPDLVRGIVAEGADKARDAARQTLDEVRRAMHLRAE